MTKTLSEPSSDVQLIETYNRGMRAADRIVLNADTSYALCLLTLNSAVQQSDYPTLKSEIEAITGISNVALVIDHHTRTSTPTDTQLVAIMDFNLRIESSNP